MTSTQHSLGERHLGVCIALVTLSACGADAHGPRLASAEPARAGANAMVELRGSRFCANHVACEGVSAQVQLGLSPPTVQANIVGYTDTTATFIVPAVAAPGDTDIVLIVDGFSSNALAFEILP